MVLGGCVCSTGNPAKLSDFKIHWCSALRTTTTIGPPPRLFSILFYNRLIYELSRVTGCTYFPVIPFGLSQRTARNTGLQHGNNDVDLCAIESGLVLSGKSYTENEYPQVPIVTYVAVVKDSMHSQTHRTHTEHPLWTCGHRSPHGVQGDWERKRQYVTCMAVIRMLMQCHTATAVCIVTTRKPY